MAKALQIPVQIVLLFMFNLSCGGVPVSRCLALAVRRCCKARVNNVAFYQTDGWRNARRATIYLNIFVWRSVVMTVPQAATIGAVASVTNMFAEDKTSIQASIFYWRGKTSISEHIWKLSLKHVKLMRDYDRNMDNEHSATTLHGDI